MFREGINNISEIQVRDTETWKVIPEFRDTYSVSNLGDVMNHRTNRILRPVQTGLGYVQVTLYDKGVHKKIAVHRLVARAFIPNPNNYPEVNHLDSNRANNRADNLEWCTHKQNIHYAAIRGRMGGDRSFYHTNTESIKKILKEKKMNQKNEVDARSFPEICKGLSQLEKETLSYALIKKGCATTRQTVWNWASGNTRPNHPAVQKLVADVVGKIIGSRVLPQTLFPAK